MVTSCLIDIFFERWPSFLPSNFVIAKVQKERQVLIQRGVLSLPGGAQLKYAGFRSRQQLTSSRSKMTFQLIFLVRQTKQTSTISKCNFSANFASSVSLLNHEILPKNRIGSLMFWENAQKYIFFTTYSKSQHTNVVWMWTFCGKQFYVLFFPSIILVLA